VPKSLGGSRGFVAGGQPESPENAIVFGASYWRSHPKELAQAIALAQPEIPSKPHAPGGKGLITDGVPASQSAARLTLTVEEAAALLGISRAFAYDAVKRNQIPHIKIGRRVLVPKAALEKMLGHTDEPDRGELS